MPYRTLLPIVLAAALLAGGCGERDEPLGELAQAYPVTVAGANDQPTTIAKRPERIVALDPGSAELLAALGVGNRLVGAPAASSGAALPPGVAKTVKPTGQIDTKVIASLTPDLIVAAPTTDRVEVSRAERETGAAVYVQPAASIEDVVRATLELGFLVDEPVAARGLATAIREKTAAVDERISAEEPTTVFVDTGFFITVPERSLLGELVRRAHGVNIAGNDAGFGPFDLEQLATLDPDVYLTTSDSGTTAESLQRNPVTSGLAAVQTGRVVMLPADLVTHAGPRIADAFEAVAAALHPDAFR